MNIHPGKVILSADTKLCKSCGREIPARARVCDACGRNQSWIWNFLNGLLPFISLAGVIFLGGQVYIASKQTTIAENQFQEAQKKRIEAETVLNEVLQVKKMADHILADTVSKVSQLNISVESVINKLDKTEKRLVTTENRFSERQQALSQNVVSLKDQLSKEIARLKNINELHVFADRAISTGQAEFYEELKSRLKSATDPELQIIIDAQISSVKRAFIGTTRIKGKKLMKGDGVVDPKELTTSELLKSFSISNDWIVRALISHELGKRKEKEVPDALIKCAQNDDILDVRRDCINAFDKLLGNKYENPDILEPAGIIKYWNDNKAQIEESWASK